jgi:hypothetical protein
MTSDAITYPHESPETMRKLSKLEREMNNEWPSHKKGMITALAIAAIACAVGVLFCTPVGGLVSLAGLTAYLGTSLISGSVVSVTLLAGTHMYRAHMHEIKKREYEKLDPQVKESRRKGAKEDQKCDEDYRYLCALAPQIQGQLAVYSSFVPVLQRAANERNVEGDVCRAFFDDFSILSKKIEELTGKLPLTTATRRGVTSASPEDVSKELKEIREFFFSLYGLLKVMNEEFKLSSQLLEELGKAVLDTKNLCYKLANPDRS